MVDNLLKTGSRWKSVVCDTEVMILRAPSTPAELACGGAPMVLSSAPRPEGIELSAAHAEGSLLGKRYSDEALGFELLCTKSGKGSLVIAGRALLNKEAKRLPSSD